MVLTQTTNLFRTRLKEEELGFERREEIMIKLDKIIFAPKMTLYHQIKRRRISRGVEKKK